MVVKEVRWVQRSEGSVTLGPWIPEPSMVEEALGPAVRGSGLWGLGV